MTTGDRWEDWANRAESDQFSAPATPNPPQPFLAYRPSPGGGYPPSPGGAYPPPPGIGYLPAGPYPPAPAGYSYRDPPWPPVPPVLAPPRRRGGGLRWVVATLVLFLVCSMMGLGALVGYIDHTGGLDTRAHWQPARTVADAPPPANAPATVWTNWARRSVDTALGEQADALLAADESGYLAAVDPGNARLVAEHKKRFKILRAMGPGVWRQVVNGDVKSTASRSWDVTVRISYCFGEATCRVAQMSVGTEWEFKQERLVLVQVDRSGAGSNGPRPWETDDLSVATGRRVVLAATKVNAWRLKDAVTYADRAAAVADTFSRWEVPPSRYVIFLAGPSDWNQWYGHKQPDWAAAWAVSVSSTVTEVVVRTQVVQQSELEQLLTHELIHVTSLAGKRDGGGASVWWLVEGLAEYGSLLEQPVRQYDALGATRAFVRGDWDGDPAVDPPSSEASLDDAAARYGVGYLAVRRIAGKYGQAKMLDFFGRVVHDGDSVETAARAALDVAWSTVRADCASFIRNSVG